MKTRGEAKFVSVNPVKTGYSAIADEWIGLRPGTDGLFVLALVHELLKAEKIDWDYLGRYTNATWLVVDDPGGARSEEHTSELQSLMRISYAVFCLTKKNKRRHKKH